MKHLLTCLALAFAAASASAQSMDSGATAVIADIESRTNSNAPLDVKITDENGPEEGWGVDAKLKPGKEYTVLCSINASPDYSSGTITVRAPAGYMVQIGGEPTTAISFSIDPVYGVDEQTTIKLIPAEALERLSAGACTNPAPDKIFWEIGLGDLPSGQGAGRIELINDGSGDWSKLAHIASLSATAPIANSAYAVSIGNAQTTAGFVLPQCYVALADDSSGTFYTIDFYNWSQVTQTNTYSYSASGTPFMHYEVAQVGGANHLQITSTATGQAGSRTLICDIQKDATGVWTTTAWHDPTATTAATTTCSVSVSGAQTTEDIQTKDSAGVLIDHYQKVFTTYVWGTELTTETHVPSPGVLLSTTYDFYQDQNAAGYSQLKSVTYPNGSWEAWDYSNSGQYPGYITNHYRQWLNSPSVVTLDPTQGSVTSYTYALDNSDYMKPRATGESTVASGVTVKKWAATNVSMDASGTAGYVLNGQKVETTTRSDSATATGAALQSKNLFYREDSQWFYSGLPVSVSHPDGTKESYGYEGGTWDGTTFTSNTDPGSSHAAIRTSIIHGCASSVTGSTEVTSLEGGEAIDPIYLTSGKSTKDVTIRQASNVVGQAESGNVVQSETWVWGGTAWTRVAWVNFAHDLGGQLVQRSASDGSTYSATWIGDFKKSETDAAGIVTTYANDGSWRVQTATVNAGTQLAALSTQFTYDGEGRLIKKVIGSNLSETLTSSVSYDTAGRKTTETAPGGVATSYEYPSNGSDLKTNFANGGSKLVAHNQDGSIQSITGTAAVAEYYSYDIRSDGAIHTVTRLGDSASSRVEETWADMLGRKVKVLRPGFAGGVGYMQLWTYDPATGQLISMSREDANGNRVAADTRYEYDFMGQLHRTGLAIDNSTQLTLAGDDRITDVDSIYKQDTINGISAWWLERTTTTYPTVNSSNGFVTNVTFDRLTGLGGALQKDSMSKDADGNITEVQTLVDGAAHTVTTSMSTVGTTNASTTVTVAGLTIQSTGFDGLTRKTGYDTLWRPYQATDARNNTSTTGFSPNTSRPASITDPAGNLTVSYTFDSAGRVSTETNVSGNVTRFAYDYLDRVTNQWGDGAYPVAYSYDEFGSKVTMTSYRAGSGWSGTTWPSSTNLGKGDVTTWAYDPATGLLVSKTDDAAAQIKYTYTVMGAVYQRTSARGVVTTYGYDPNTAELTSVTYSDGTHPINYSYARTGALNWAQDATSVGANDYTRFNYNPSQPLQLQSIQFGQFFSNRFFTPQYNTDGSRPGRNTGYFLGGSASSASDLSQTYGYDSTMRLHQVTSASAGQGSIAFTYTYSPGTDWVGQMAASGPNGTYQVNYAYENKRDLVTQAQASWGGSAGTVLAEFDYQYDAQGRRRSAQKSGTAFADLYSGAAVTPVYSYYVYDAKGQLQTEVAYRGVPPSSGAPASGDEIPGRRFEYRYDNFGNRAVTGPADPSGSASAVDDAYTTVNYGHLNQYDSKQNNTVRVLGDAVVGASVTIPGASVNQLDRNFGASVVPANNSGPARGSIPVTANLTVGGTTYTDTQSRNYLVPAASQPMGYDADGNLTSDGMWTYVYDGEDRLVEMDSQLPTGQGFTRWELKFKYDYLGRRVEKQVYNMDVSLSSPTLDHKFIYSGWNLIAETDASGSLLNTYTWGLDIASSFTETGGVGALLEYTPISNGAPINYFVAVDANGDVAGLVSSGGSQTTPSLAAVYEYASFGEPLRAEVLDTTVATNPFRFSSKYTDAESGLVYYGNRYYSSTVGRFINRDPAGEAGGLNLYGFVNNDPVNHSDVLGDLPTLDKYVVTADRYFGDPMQEWSDQNLINSVWGQQVGQYLGGPIPSFKGFNPFLAAPSLSLLSQAMATRNAIIQAQQAQNMRLKSNIRLRMYAMLGALMGIADAKGINISPNSPFGGFVSRLLAFQSGFQAAAVDVVKGQWNSFLSAGFDTNRMLLNQGLGMAKAILHLPTILSGIMSGYQTAADSQDGGTALSKYLGYGMFHVALAAALGGEGGAPAAESAAPRTIGEILEGAHPDSMIHLTPAGPESFAGGVESGTYWARLGDVSHMTIEQYQLGVVGPDVAASLGEPVSGFVVSSPGTGSFMWEGAFNPAGVMEYTNSGLLKGASYAPIW